eukprot:gene27433-32617_t
MGAGSSSSKRRSASHRGNVQRDKIRALETESLDDTLTAKLSQMADALAAVASKVDRMEEQNSNADDQQRDRATFEEREEHWVEGHEEHDAGTQLTEESQQDVLVEEDSSAAAVDDDHGHDANPAEDGMQPLPDVRVLADVARGDHSPIPSPPDGGAHARKFSTTSS